MDFTPSIFPVTKEIQDYYRKKEADEAKVSTGSDSLPQRRVDLPGGGFYYVYTGLREVVDELLRVARKKGC